MKISLNEVKKYVKIPQNTSNEELLETIGSRLVEIEEVVDLEPKYRGCYIVKVVSCEPIEGTHLNLCQIDAGAVGAQFSDTDTVQVVCGAPNVHAGMLAVWITPGAIVPQTYGGEDFELGVRKLRGYDSNGMLAGADELDLDNEHKSIAEINPRDAKPGDSFAEVFELNDLIIDVENKSLTHRPDCFGLVGFAREVAGVLGLKFEEPEWIYGELKPHPGIKVDITDSELCPRYSCAVFELPDNQPSKYLTKEAVFLAKAGMRAIDPMVDLTNIIMLQTGQPLHAFDYDKFVEVGEAKTPTVIVRAAEKNEELQLLDGKVVQCIPEDILITSNGIPVALAGAMGGKNTEIDPSTKRVILESATFSLYHLRKTQMAHGIFSEAITRFTKGQPAPMTMPVLTETVRRLGVEPQSVTDEYPDKTPASIVKITENSVNDLLGTHYTTEQIVKTLTNVGFQVEHGDEPKEDTEIRVQAPKWRTDIHIAEDVIEEVGRLLGFDNIELTLPKKPFSGTEVAPLWRFKQKLREALSCDLGMNELLTYSFVSADLLEKAGQDPENSYQIVNSISPELQRFRQQITPSLIGKVRENLKSDHTNFTLYEMNQVSSRTDGLSEESIPVLKQNLGIVDLGDFYHIKAQVLTLFRKKLHLGIEYTAMSPNVAKDYPYLEPLRSAVLNYNGQIIGAFGEVKATVLKRFKIDQAVSAAEITLDSLAEAKPELSHKTKISRFPFVERDLTLKVGEDAQFGRFDNEIRGALVQEGLIFTLRPLSVYQPSPESTTRNISFRLRFSSPERTLEQKEISDIMEKITVSVTKLGAEVI